jgi:hypothetical protein
MVLHKAPVSKGLFFFLCPPRLRALSLRASQLGDDYAKCPGLLQARSLLLYTSFPGLLRSSDSSSPATSTARYAHPLVIPSFCSVETEHPNPNLLFVFGSDLLGPPLIYFGQYSSFLAKEEVQPDSLFSPLISSSF